MFTLLCKHICFLLLHVSNLFKVFWQSPTRTTSIMVLLTFSGEFFLKEPAQAS